MGTSGKGTELALQIRAATSADIPILVAYNAALAWDTEKRRLRVETLRAGVERALAAPQLCHYYVAELDGRVIGQTMVTYELTDWENGLVHWIQSVYVHPEHRGQGVFRRLYDHVLRVASEGKEARKVRLYVEKDNDTAIATYERLGMQRAHFHIYQTEL